MLCPIIMCQSFSVIIKIIVYLRRFPFQAVLPSTTTRLRYTNTKYEGQRQV